MKTEKRLIKRNIKLFFADKGLFFTSLITPLILLVLYATFLAKVYRDRLMEKLAEEYPMYGIAKHKGYPTAAHFAVLRELGPCPEHRRSFGPVSQLTLF